MIRARARNNTLCAARARALPIPMRKVARGASQTKIAHRERLGPARQGWELERPTINSTNINRLQEQNELYVASCSDGGWSMPEIGGQKILVYNTVPNYFLHLFQWHFSIVLVLQVHMLIYNSCDDVELASQGTRAMVFNANATLPQVVAGVPITENITWINNLCLNPGSSNLLRSSQCLCATGRWERSDSE